MVWNIQVWNFVCQNLFSFEYIYIEFWENSAFLNLIKFQSLERSREKKNRGVKKRRKGRAGRASCAAASPAQQAAQLLGPGSLRRHANVTSGRGRALPRRRRRRRRRTTARQVARVAAANAAGRGVPAAGGAAAFGSPERRLRRANAAATYGHAVGTPD